MTREELRREFALKLKFTTSSTRITQLLLEYDRKLQELSLPPAEGAEEILKKHMNKLPAAYVTFISQYEKDRHSLVIAAMEEFATLHAQRIADKMVSERLIKMRPKDEDFPEFDESKKNDAAYCVEWGMLKQRDIERRVYDRALDNPKSREQ